MNRIEYAERIRTALSIIRFVIEEKEESFTKEEYELLENQIKSSADYLDLLQAD